jgi:hypothetical protein
MNEAEFWRIIDLTTHACIGDGGGETQAELLIQYLSELSEGEILDFDYIFRKLHAQAYSCKLWEAAQIIADGCSDDGFTDFCAGLIGRGQAIYEAALTDPENLLDVVEAGEYISAEFLNYVAMNAYEIRTGLDHSEMPSHHYGERLSFKGEWSKQEELPIKYPKLYAKFNTYWENYYDSF